MNIWDSIDEPAIIAGADSLLRIALQFNQLPELEGVACCAVFDAVRVTLGLVYDDASAFLDECLRSGITCAENAKYRYEELCRAPEEEDLF